MFLSSATGTFLRPDLPDNAAPRTSAVKTGRRPPAKPAQRGLDGREHGANLNQVGSAPVFKPAAPPGGGLSPLNLLPAGLPPRYLFPFSHFLFPLPEW